MMERCPHCRVILDGIWSQKPQHYMLESPWRILFEMWTATCPKCRNEVRSVLNSVDRYRVTWLKCLERDIRAVSCMFRRPGPARVGRLPLNVLWLWSPLINNNDWARIMWRQADAIAEPGRACAVILAGNTCLPDKLADIPVSVDEIWRLVPTAMEDQHGPFPSLRAELTIAAAVERHVGHRIYHCWPAASLNKEHYLPLGSDQSIAQAYAAESRRRLSVHVNRGNR